MTTTSSFTLTLHDALPISMTDISGHSSGASRTAVISSDCVEPTSSTISRRGMGPRGAISARRSTSGRRSGNSASDENEGFKESDTHQGEWALTCLGQGEWPTLGWVSNQDVTTTAQRLAEFRQLQEQAIAEPAATAQEKQNARGKLSARERIEMLLDPDSFVEVDALVRHRSTNFGREKRRPNGDGVVAGYGTVDGRQVCVYAQDFSVFGGSLGEVHGQKITKVMDLALRTGVPLIGINDGGGARIQEGVAGLTQFAEIFRRNVAASGVIPQISMILGPCAGGAVYSPALTDFVVMTEEHSHMFITGPDVIKTVTGEDVGFDELGGGKAHNAQSGVSHYLATDEEDAFEYVKALLAHLPSNNLDDLPTFEADVAEEVTPTDEGLDTLMPDSPNQPYDMREVLTTILDDGEFLEVQPLFAQNVLTGDRKSVV